MTTEGVGSVALRDTGGSKGRSMTDADELLSLMLRRWDELRRQGDPISIDELCRDHPHLRPELELRIGEVQAIDSLLDGFSDDLAARHASGGRTEVTLTVTDGPHRGRWFTFRQHDTF